MCLLLHIHVVTKVSYGFYCLQLTCVLVVKVAYRALERAISADFAWRQKIKMCVEASKSINLQEWTWQRVRTTTHSSLYAQNTFDSRIVYQEILTNMQRSTMQRSTLSRCRIQHQSLSLRPCRQNRGSLQVVNLFTGIVQGIATVAEVNSKRDFVQMQVAFPAGKMTGIQVRVCTFVGITTDLEALPHARRIVTVTNRHAQTDLDANLGDFTQTNHAHHTSVLRAPHTCLKFLPEQHEECGDAVIQSFNSISTLSCI